MKYIKGVLSSISSISLAIFLIVAGILGGAFLILGPFFSLIVLAPVELPANFGFGDFLRYFVHEHGGKSFLCGVVIFLLFIRFAMLNSRCNTFEWHVRTKGEFDTDYQRDTAIKATVADFLLTVLLASVAVAMAVLIPKKDMEFYLIFTFCLIMGIVAVIGALCKISLIKLPVIPPNGNNGPYNGPQYPDPWNLH